MERIIESALEAGAALGQPVAIKPTDDTYAVVPGGYALTSLEKYKPAPDRKKGVITLDDAESFIQYFNLHATEQSQIYGKVNPPSFVGVINDHGVNDAGWRDHLAKYDCPFTAEWVEWSRSDKKIMQQSEFAEFIERNLPDIVEPVGADMLEISRSLQAKKKVSFASGIRLANGQTELTYEEDIQGTAAKGKLQIPEIFKIGIKVIEGGEAYAVECRLRYRINEASLVMWYELVRPHKVIEDAVADLWALISNQTCRSVLRGQI